MSNMNKRKKNILLEWIVSWIILFLIIFGFGGLSFDGDKLSDLFIFSAGVSFLLSFPVAWAFTNQRESKFAKKITSFVNYLIEGFDPPRKK